MVLAAVGKNVLGKKERKKAWPLTSFFPRKTSSSEEKE
jgi:hypothetical protein